VGQTFLSAAQRAGSLRLADKNVRLTRPTSRNLFPDEFQAAAIPTMNRHHTGRTIQSFLTSAFSAA
jgi:hypothetical protein